MNLSITQAQALSALSSSVLAHELHGEIVGTDCRVSASDIVELRQARLIERVDIASAYCIHTITKLGRKVARGAEA